MKQTPLQRKPMKRSQPKRDWRSAREKVEAEGACRSCGRTEPRYRLQAAHVIGRKHDFDSPNGLVPDGDPNAYFVRPDRIVPLCPICHGDYDRYELDLLPSLTLAEQLRAVEDAGGIELARRRITGNFSPQEEAA